jgi:AhpD family alkylhydroperoxidase
MSQPPIDIVQGRINLRLLDLPQGLAPEKAEETLMTREEIYQDMKEAIGLVPGFFKTMPDESLECEWKVFKFYILEDKSNIPPKYRELIGAAAAAAKQCWYCSNFHAGLAKLHGATDEEIEEAVHLAKLGGSWSTYLNGMLYDRDTFMKELTAVGEYVSKK